MPTDTLAQYIRSQTTMSRVCIAYSGGMDSHVLLHAAALLMNDQAGVSLRAVHVDHGLHEESKNWVRHAEFVCDQLSVPLVTRRVNVDELDNGPEAAARLARYEAFASVLLPGEHLMLAQHADDQAETFLLQALRGSGPDGLAAIPHKRTFAEGYMARPLLSCSQTALSTYAQTHGLSWIEDPSNQESRYDRNFIRHEIMPLLQSRWPAAAKTLSRSAMRSAAASQTLIDLAKDDLEIVRDRGVSELNVQALKTLTRERMFNVIRLWVRQSGLRMPRLQDLRQLEENLLHAADDSAGLVNAREYQFRRHRDRLYLMMEQTDSKPFTVEWHAPYDDLVIPETGQLLSKSACERQGLRLPEDGFVTVRNRAGGELIKLGEPAFHKAVKKVLQEAAVPPWERDSIPLLYVGGRLAAVWNVTVAIDFKDATESA